MHGNVLAFANTIYKAETRHLFACSTAVVLPFGIRHFKGGPGLTGTGGGGAHQGIYNNFRDPYLVSFPIPTMDFLGQGFFEHG